MRRVGVTQLKNELSRWLRLVKRGETIEVVERDVPIARISALRDAHEDTDQELARLIRDGIVSPARERPDLDALRRKLIPCRSDAAAAVVDERGDR